MDVAILASYLTSGKQNITNIKSRECYVVLGNESCDLDSVLSSIVMGYYTAHSLYQVAKDNGADVTPLVFSVVNCSREDLPLRTESAFFLKENGIQLRQLICRDEIDLNGLHASGNLKLTMVDHNLLGSGDAQLESSVSRVIDHHKQMRELKPGDIIETVGSCCTLVSEVVLGVFASDPIVCRLLYGTILLDTVNLSPAAGKTTPKDLKVIQQLETALSAAGPHELPNRDELFQALVAARADVSQLTPAQLLRKDTKDLRFDEFALAIPAVPLLAQKLLALPNILETFKSTMSSRRVNALVILGLYIEESNQEMQRDIIVYSDSIDRAKEICTVLENSELKAELIRTSMESDSGLFGYLQGNVALSRKYVVPLLEKHFTIR